MAIRVPAGANKTVAGFLACTLLIISLAFPIKAQKGKELNVSLHRQETPVWCWAASIAMVVGYFQGRSLEDCDVLSAYDRQSGGPGQCCGNPRCIRGGQPGEMEYILGRVFGVHGVKKGAIPFNEVVSNIDDNKPLIVQLMSSPTSGHVVVVSGYRYPGEIKVLDPIYGEYWVPYQTLIANWQYGYWVGTFTFTTTRGGGDRQGSRGGREDDQESENRNKPVTFTVEVESISLGRLGAEIGIWIDGKYVGKIANLGGNTSVGIDSFPAGRHTYRISAKLYKFDAYGNSYYSSTVQGSGSIDVEDGDTFKAEGYGGTARLVKQ